MIRYYGQLTMLALACFFAWKRGGSPERAAAAVVASMYVLDPIYHAIWGLRTVYGEVNVGHLVIDLWMTAALLPIALWANRIWTLWLVSAQLIAVLSHFLRWISPDLHPFVYAMFIRGPSYLQIALLFVGTELHRRRVRRIGNYPSWRSF